MMVKYLDPEAKIQINQNSKSACYVFRIHDF